MTNLLKSMRIVVLTSELHEPRKRVSYVLRRLIADTLRK